MPGTSTSERGRATGGFSLVEVLLALLILAIGLLGLGAAIPAVVAQQRRASDELQGIAAAESALADLLSRRDLNRLDPPSSGSAQAIDGQGFGAWIRDDDWSDDFLFANVDEDEDGEYDLDTGEWVIGKTSNLEIRIPVAQRLWPRPGSSSERPRFIWDIIARRVPPDNQLAFGDAYDKDDPALSPPRIDLVVFVRRIDAGIPVPSGASLFQVITGLGSIPDSSVKVAVGVNPDGEPTLNGEGDYSVPRRLNVKFKAIDGRRDILELLDSPDTGVENTVARRLVSRPGQRIVDNLGNVYTVLRPATSEDASGVPDNSVVIRPPVPAGVPENGKGEEDWQELRQIVFTPQIPAAVRVQRITVTNPPEGL